MAAREAHEKENKDFEYIDVLSAPKKLETMLSYSKGKRKVPVIVAEGRVMVGWQGKS
jgi:glutaredoxin